MAVPHGRHPKLGRSLIANEHLSYLPGAAFTEGVHPRPWLRTPVHAGTHFDMILLRRHLMRLCEVHRRFWKPSLNSPRLLSVKLQAGLKTADV